MFRSNGFVAPRPAQYANSFSVPWHSIRARVPLQPQSRGCRLTPGHLLWPNWTNYHNMTCGRSEGLLTSVLRRRRMLTIPTLVVVRLKRSCISRFMLPLSLAHLPLMGGIWVSAPPLPFFFTHD